MAVTWKQMRDAKLTMNRIEELNHRAELVIMGTSTDSDDVDFYETEFQLRADAWIVKALCQSWMDDHEGKTGEKRMIRGL